MPRSCMESSLEVGAQPLEAWRQTSHAKGTLPVTGVQTSLALRTQRAQSGAPARCGSGPPGEGNSAHSCPRPYLLSQAGTLLALGGSHLSTGPLGSRPPICGWH